MDKPWELAKPWKLNFWINIFKFSTGHWVSVAKREEIKHEDNLGSDADPGVSIDPVSGWWMRGNKRSSDND